MSLDAMKQALEALEWNLPVIEDYGDHEQLGRQYRAITALRAAIEEPEFWVQTSEQEQEQEQETVYDTGGFELEARFYSGAELREMIKALDAMNASVRRMMGEI